MLLAGADRLADALLDVVLALSAVEEGDVLFPGHADDQSDAVVERDVEEPAGRGGIEPDGVEPGLGHGGEIAGDFFGCAVFPAGLVGVERAVRDALDVELGVIDKEELAADDRAGLGAGCRDRLARGR